MNSERANVVIIGGGCIGTSTAYHLCKAGVEGVVLLERDFLGYGSTGRCGGGMRQQWSTHGNVVLAKHSLEAFRNFQRELGQDIEFVEGGYLLTAYTQEHAEQFQKNISLQNSLGINTRFVTPEQVQKIAPLLNTAGMIGAAWEPTDGKANPFLVVKGYWEQAARMGADIRIHSPVVALKTSGGKVVAVVTEGGKIQADWVVNAAGGYAGEVAALAGAEVPINPYRHQIFVTEPLQPCHDPMVIDLHHNIYFSQNRHGAFLAGQTDWGEPASFKVTERWQSCVQIAEKFVKLMPSLGKLNILRQWAGLYAVTPDRQPIIGPCPPYDNFLIAGGFSGHGFMLSPVTGRLVSEIIIHGRAVTVDTQEYSIERFRSKDFTVEQNVV